MTGVQTCALPIFGVATPAAGSINVSTTTLGHLAGVSKIVVGTQGSDSHANTSAGDVTVGPVITNVPVQVYGGNISIEAGTGNLIGGAGILLDGSKGIALHDDLAVTKGNIALYSASGNIQMDAGTSMQASSTGKIELRASGNIGVSQLWGDTVVLESTGGTIQDVRADNNPDIVAKTVSIHGYGPKVGGSGDAIEVRADTVFVTAPAGVVSQTSGSDDKTRFYVVNGGDLYQIATGFGSISRVAANPTTFLPAGGGSSTPITGSLSTQTLASVTFSTSSNLPNTSDGVASYLNVSRADLFGASFTLGSPGRQPLSTGQSPTNNIDFDYWLEDLVV